METPMTTNATNITARIYTHPSVNDYYTKINPFITLTMFVGSLLFLLNISIFSSTVTNLRKRINKPLLGPTIAMCGFYPLIALSALLTIFVPKAWLVCHTIMHLSFTVGAVVFHRLCFRYVGSEMNYVKEADGAAVIINTPPCCCCCMCLPRMLPSKSKFCILRYMVWQMPFVQGSVMLVLNGIYYQEQDLYAKVLLYFVPFIVGSILCGLWALNITVRMVNSIHSEYGLMRKMLCLQLILLLCKLQYVILDSQLNILQMGQKYPMNHTVYKQAIINILILAEMVLVSLLAQNAYKIPVEILESSSIIQFKHSTVLN